MINNGFRLNYSCYLKPESQYFLTIFKIKTQRPHQPDGGALVHGQGDNIYKPQESHTPKHVKNKRPKKFNTALISWKHQIYFAFH